MSQWEAGRLKRIGATRLRALDDCFQAGGALVGLARALRTPDGLPPRTVWAHNVQGESGPAWAWVRPTPRASRVDTILVWGAFAYTCKVDCGDAGVFVTSPASMPNPAVWVHLRTPGWVDFGRGSIPGDLGIPAFAALSGAEISSGHHRPAGLVRPDLVRRFRADRAFAKAVLGFFGERPDLVAHTFSASAGENIPADLRQRPTAPPIRDAAFTGRQYERLRECRGFSLQDAATLVTELLPEEPITRDRVRDLEKGRRTRARRLRSRLDRLYGADGHVCVEEVAVHRYRDGSAVIDFPTYWIGPVWFWFQAAGKASAPNAMLRWEDSYIELRLGDKRLATCRRPTEDPTPFVISCGKDWEVRAGMGHRPEARDINFGWLRDDEAAPAVSGDAEVHEVFLQWFGRTLEEFRNFLNRYDAG